MNEVVKLYQCPEADEYALYAFHYLFACLDLEDIAGLEKLDAEAARDGAGEVRVLSACRGPFRKKSLFYFYFIFFFFPSFEVVICEV